MNSDPTGNLKGVGIERGYPQAPRSVMSLEEAEANYRQQSQLLVEAQCRLIATRNDYEEAQCIYNLAAKTADEAHSLLCDTTVTYNRGETIAAYAGTKANR